MTSPRSQLCKSRKTRELRGDVMESGAQRSEESAFGRGQGPPSRAASRSRRPRRGRRSLAVGEAHGKRRPWMFDPYGVEYLFAPCRLVRRFHLRLMILFPFGELRGLRRDPELQSSTVFLKIYSRLKPASMGRRRVLAHTSQHLAPWPEGLARRAARATSEVTRGSILFPHPTQDVAEGWFISPHRGQTLGE